MANQQNINISKFGEVKGDSEQVNKGSLEQFLKLPWDIYNSSQLSETNWVPPNLKELRFVLSKENPFFEHAYAALFLAEKEGKPVGRIAAIVDHNHIKEHNENAGFFGFYESINDISVAKALFDSAGEWLKGEKMELIKGPMNPSINDECGLLIEGFDMPPQIMMPYNPEYYIHQIEQNGFSSAKTLNSYILTKEVISSNEKLQRMAKFPQKRGFTTRQIRLKNLESELSKVKEIYNDAWSRNWGYVPMTDKEIDSMAKRLVDLVDPSMVLFCEKERKGKEPEPIAFLLAVPNYNIALKHMDGKDGLTEKLKFIKYGGFPANMLNGQLRKLYGGKINECRLITLGVKKEYQGGPYTASLLQLFQKNIGKRYTVDMSWTLEDNIYINRVIEGLGGRLYKKHRIYEKKI